MNQTKTKEHYKKGFSNRQLCFSHQNLSTDSKDRTSWRRNNVEQMPEYLKYCES